MSTTAQTTTTPAAAAPISDGAWRPCAFVSDSATLDGDTLRVRGQLHAAGRQIPLELDATVREVDGELEVDAVTEADHCELGMTWSPLGILRAPSKLIVRGRLVRR